MFPYVFNFKFCIARPFALQVLEDVIGAEEEHGADDGPVTPNATSGSGAAEEVAEDHVGSGPQVDGEVEGETRPADAPSGEENICTICRFPLVQEGPTAPKVQMLMCGHAHHLPCLERAWSVGGHPQGWCPFKCDVTNIVIPDDPAADGSSSTAARASALVVGRMVLWACDWRSSQVRFWREATEWSFAHMTKAR